MHLDELNDYVQNLEYENKRMGDFISKLGYSSEAITDIIINSSDTITKVQTYAIIKSSMDKLELLSDDIETIKKELYQFIDTHYDFSKFKPNTTT
jgi:hypothetical protein